METTRPPECPHCGAAVAVQGQPGVCPQCGQPIATVVPEADPGADSAVRPDLSGEEAFKVISDTVVGPNVRLKDNLYQAIAIGVCVLLGAGICALIALGVNPDRGALSALGGAIVGGIAGLIVGTLGSGLFLMVYRFIRHVRGQHD